MPWWPRSSRCANARSSCSTTRRSWTACWPATPSARRQSPRPRSSACTTGSVSCAVADVVLFDLDDTLFQHRESVIAGIHGHRSALGGVLAAIDARAAAEHWNALEEEHYHRYLTGELD